MKPTMKYKSDLVILHFDTNDLRSEKSSNEIANDIIKIGMNMKREKIGIIPRRDTEYLDKK